MGNNNLIYSIKNAKVYFCIFAVFMAVLIKSDTFAATIHSAEYLEANDVSQDIDYGSDYKNIMAAFKEDGMVKLYEGESYYIDKTIMLQDDWSFDATGATIYRDGVLFSHEITKTGYGSLNNVTLKGGTYLSTLKNGYNKTFIHFTHAKNINIEDMVLKASSYTGHTIELVACNNVTVKNCEIIPKGKCPANSVEEQIQIDIATGTTYPAISGSKYANGATCKNIKIIGCTVKGCRAVCANYSPREKKYMGKIHTNITIRDCKLTGMSSEALALFNTSSAVVEGNTIITKAPLSRNSYSVGCHFHMFGTNKAFSKGKISVSDNTIKGGRQGLYFYSQTSSQYGTVKADNNKLYCRKSKDGALFVKCTKKFKEKGNTLNKW